MKKIMKENKWLIQLTMITIKKLINYLMKNLIVVKLRLIMILNENIIYKNIIILNC